jgi:cobalt-zinc-cadmium efflux system protein
MTDTHDHSGHGDVTGRPLKITLGLVLVIMVAEVIGGLVSNSLALLSDAGHMLTDALALGLSLIAISLARRPATRRFCQRLHPDSAFRLHLLRSRPALLRSAGS